MSGTIGLDTVEKFTAYEKSLECTRERLESESRRIHKQYAYRGEKELLWDDMERIRGAAMALEQVFGVHDFVIVHSLGIGEVRERFGKACEMEIAAAKRRNA